MVPSLILRLEGFEGNPSIEVSLEDGRVSGLEQILPEVRDDGNTLAMAHALHKAAETFEQIGNHAAACTVYEGIARIFAEAGRGLDHGITMNNLGLALKRAGRSDEAKTRYEESLALLRTPMASPSDDRLRIQQLAHVLLNLAILWHERGDRGKVERYARWARSAIEGVDAPAARQLRERCDSLLRT